MSNVTLIAQLQTIRQEVTYQASHLPHPDGMIIIDGAVQLVNLCHRYSVPAELFLAENQELGCVIANCITIRSYGDRMTIHCSAMSYVQEILQLIHGIVNALISGGHAF